MPPLPCRPEEAELGILSSQMFSSCAGISALSLTPHPSGSVPSCPQAPSHPFFLAPHFLSRSMGAPSPPRPDPASVTEGSKSLLSSQQLEGQPGGGDPRGLGQRLQSLVGSRVGFRSLSESWRAGPSSSPLLHPQPGQQTKRSLLLRLVWGSCGAEAVGGAQFCPRGSPRSSHPAAPPRT